MPKPPRTKLAPLPPPLPPTPKPLDIGETVLVTGADDLRGYNPHAVEQQIGRLHAQLQTLTARYLAMTARTQAVMVQHGAAIDDKAKEYILDTDKMTLTRTK